MKSLFLLPALASAFIINVPSTLTAGSTVTAEWTRHTGDPAKFTIRLRRLGGDTVGILQSVDSNGGEKGQVTLPEKVDVGYVMPFVIVIDRLDIFQVLPRRDIPREQVSNLSFFPRFSF